MSDDNVLVSDEGHHSRLTTKLSDKGKTILRTLLSDTQEPLSAGHSILCVLIN